MLAPFLLPVANTIDPRLLRTATMSDLLVPQSIRVD